MECGFDLESPLEVSEEILTSVAVWVRPAFDPSARVRRDPLVWSTVEYLAHLRDAISFYRVRIDLIMTSQTPPSLQPWDPDEACVVNHYSEGDPGLAYEQAVRSAADLGVELRSVSALASCRYGL
jgi:hypothetical protein